MVRFFKLICFLALGSFLFTSCATILAPSDQDVNFHTPSEETAIEINGDSIGAGSTVQANLNKDGSSKQIKIDHEDYVENYSVIYQNNRHWLTWVSIVPFAPLTFFSMLDQGDKSRTYESDYQVSYQDVPLVERDEDQRYIFLDETHFDIDSDNFTVNKFREGSYQEGGSPYDRLTASEEFSLEAEGLTHRLNGVLHNHNFIDTTDNIFTDRTNSLHLSAEIIDLETDEVIVTASPNQAQWDLFYRSTVEMKWSLRDVYNQTIHEETIKATSGEFMGTAEDVASSTITHAVYASLFTFLNAEDVKEHKQIKEEKGPEFEPITLERGTKPATMEEAQSATVTIETEEGHGSGCAVGRDGYIITNFHVIATHEDDLTILIDGDQEYEAELVRKNEYQDLALLKVKDKTFEYTFDISEYHRAGSGKEAYAIGTPASVELGQTVNRGIISGYRDHNERTWIQSDVGTSPGNSGGALLDEGANFQGVLVSKMTGYDVENISFAIPTDRVEEGLQIRYSAVQ